MKNPFSLILTLGLITTVPLSAQLATYSFTGQSLAATYSDRNLGVSSMGVLDLTATTSVSNTSPVYGNGSGSYYYSTTHWTASPVNAFTFTLTPNPGYEFSAATISFGMRSTSTGPTLFDIRSSRDSYAATLGSGSITNDNLWHDTGAVSITLSGLTNATTFRIYASGASSAGGSFKVDDIVISGSTALAAVPEPSTSAAIFGVMTLAGVITIRRRRLMRRA